MSKILLVDDEIVIATRLEEILSAKGYSVTGTVTTGEEAIEKAAQLRPDLILMDIVLTGELDGIDAAVRIKETLNIPVVFLSAYSDKDFIARAKQVEPLGYILKPFTDDQVVTAVEVALYKSRMEKKLREKEQRFALFMDHVPGPVFIKDKKSRYLYINRHMAESLKEKEWYKKTPHDLFSRKKAERYIKEDRRALEKGLYEGQEQSKGEDGGALYYRTFKFPVLRDGKAALVGGVSIDITKQKMAEKSLREAQQRLEERVRERTRELKEKTQNLEELNTALKVLLKKRDEDKAELEEKVLLNVRQLVLPYLEKLLASGLNSTQATYVNIIESNLSDIVSPFALTLTNKYFSLTPMEISVSNLIKQGKSTKDIGKLLKLSSKTVESHRKNIRRKLGLTNRRANLRTHLITVK